MYFLILIAAILFLFFLILYNGKEYSQENISKDESAIEVHHHRDKKKFPQSLIKTSSSPIDFEKLTIPKYRQKLLYISKGNPLNTGLSHSIHLNLSSTGVESETHGPDEPSAIFIKQPIKKPENPDLVTELGYFPSYAQMNPFQKWIYLDWLCDVTKPIDIGYVFTFYYGLERQLLDGLFEEAFNEINLLRKHHKNNSFQSYSLNSLINAVNIKNRFDLLKTISIDDDYDKINNSALYISYKLELDLHSDVLLSIVNSIPGTNRRYIKKNRNIYKESLEEVLTKKYSTNSYPFSKIIDIKSVKKRKVKGFANYSLPDEYRELSYPDFLGNKNFTNDVLQYHKEAHEMTKKKLRELRKQRKNT